MAEYDENQAEFEKEKEQAHHLSALLVYQVIPAIAGDPMTPDSGFITMTKSLGGCDQAIVDEAR